ncbi:tyrosyl-DNA phosphodiesterase 1 [Entophlyctis luteolus]|nr:tyrosyl-DNA phosphodiesterase 1 [Entophlyctis luteolus]
MHSGIAILCVTYFIRGAAASAPAANVLLPASSAFVASACALLTFTSLPLVSATTADEDDYFDSFDNGDDIDDDHDDEYLLAPHSIFASDDTDTALLPTAAKIIHLNAEYSKEKAHERNLDNNVLAYITPWNNHGYDIAKYFRGKFTHLAPVWYQLKPDRRSPNQWLLTGDHDVDRGWIKEVTEPVQSDGEGDVIPKMVPRFMVADLTQEDLQGLATSEASFSNLNSLIIKECKKQNHDGFVFEFPYSAYTPHLVQHLSREAKEAGLEFFLVIPPTHGDGGREMFGREHFDAYKELVNGFSLMTYDFSSHQRRPGPNAPIGWVVDNIRRLVKDPKDAPKLLVGLNMYGNDYSSTSQDSVIGPNYIQLLRKYNPNLKWDRKVYEHSFLYTDESSGNIHEVWYPTIESIKSRVQAIRHLHPGIHLTSLETEASNSIANVDCMSLRKLLSLRPVPITCMFQFNYMLEPEFFFSHIPPESRASEIVFVVHRNPALSSLKALPRTRFIFPRVEQFGTHHSKMMILFYADTRAHIVIHTANLVERDWGQKSQMCWVSSLLQHKEISKDNPQKRSPSTSNPQFEQDFMAYLGAYGKELEPLRKRLQEFDLTQERAQIIASVPGRHKGPTDLCKWGHKKLGQTLAKTIVRDDSETKGSQMTVVCQFSSIGSLGKDDSWLIGEFANSLCPHRLGRGLLTANQKNGSAGRMKIALIYPTWTQVRDSLQGWSAGNSIPFSNDNWLKQKDYMRPLLRKWVSKNAGREFAMPHVKTFALLNEQTKDISWILVTSHNLSKAAWGSLQLKGTQLFIRSYEIGVLLAPDYFKTEKIQNVTLKCFTAREMAEIVGDLAVDKDDSPNLDIVVPVRLPYDLPLTPYNSADDPWRWDVAFEGLDSHGERRVL